MIPLNSPYRIFALYSFLFFALPAFFDLRSEFRPISYEESTRYYLVSFFIVLVILSCFERRTIATRIASRYMIQGSTYVRFIIANVLYLFLLLFLIFRLDTASVILDLYSGSGEALATAVLRNSLIASNPDVVAVKLLSYANNTFSPVYVISNLFLITKCSIPSQKSTVTLFQRLSFILTLPVSLICIFSTGARSELLWFLFPVILLFAIRDGIFDLRKIISSLLVPVVILFFLLLIVNLYLTGALTTDRYGSISFIEIIFIQIGELLARIVEAPYVSAHIYHEYSNTIADFISRPSKYIWLGLLKPLGLSGVESLPKDVGYWHQSFIDPLYASMTHANASFLITNRLLFGGFLGFLVSLIQLWLCKLPFMLVRCNSFSYMLTLILFKDLLNNGVNSVIVPTILFNLCVSLVILNLLFRQELDQEPSTSV